MRLWLLIAGLVMVGVLVVLIPRLGGDEGHAPRRGHPETAAAAVALVYARGMQVGAGNIACGTLTADAARAAGCGTPNVRLRACGDVSIPGTRVVRFEAARATVELGSCRIEMVPGERTEWAVTRVEDA